MKISARNQIKGTVKTIREGAVNAVVVICRGNHNPIKADITMEAVKDLGLAEGKECYAVIKATNVMFATSKIAGISARNQIEGTIVKVVEGAVGILDGHVAVHGTLDDLHDLAIDLVAGGNALDLLRGEHDVGGLDDRVALLALDQAELLDGLHGNVGLDGVVVAAADDDDRVDGAFLHALDGALDLVACADLHGVLPFFTAISSPLPRPKFPAVPTFLRRSSRLDASQYRSARFAMAR